MRLTIPSRSWMQIPSAWSSPGGCAGAVATFVLQHTETEMDELAHGGPECGHLALPATEQTLVLGLDVGGFADAHHGGHVEGGTQSRIAGPGQARSPANACS